ncbi:MAG TPA: aspartate aminotransferase family protein [Bryobacteraceae bacterium]|nr:aspartate aminotransferase family protein [Bryobacteraceae bacterium]
MSLTATAVQPSAISSYQDCVNPQWVRLLNVLDMNVRYARCTGAELFTADGRRIVDFLSGYCVHNAGHNHPEIVEALKQELDRGGPAMLQSHVPELAGELAAKLCSRAGGRLKKAFFCSSGSEGVEAAIKFSRAHTGRAGLVYARGAFHGLTCGALSLMDEPFWSEGFGPMLPDTHPVPFGDLGALEERLATRRMAAFLVEPIQAEGGIRLPAADYLANARKLCSRFGTLFALDEVQTGMYRTGTFLASQARHADPDLVVLAKALSGGLVPSGALLMTDEVYNSVYGSLRRAIVHTSTFSENGLAMRAGLATLEVLERERLGERAAALGSYLRDRLRDALSGYEMVKDVRGAGLMNGIEFTKPRSLKLRVPLDAFHHIHPGMFGQVLVMRLFRQGFLTQICGNHFMVLKAAPPLMAPERFVDEFVEAVRTVVDEMHTSASFWTEALGMARRVMDI